MRTLGETMNAEKPQIVLKNIKETSIRFSEVDSLGIVWHGHYVTFMEDGRESFGAAHGISYLDIQAAGYSTPVVSIRCNYKRALKYGEKILIETSYIDSPAAKIIFHYKIYRENFKELVAEGESVQVFLDSEGQLCLVNPVFIEAWKLKWLGGGNVHG